MIARPFNLHKWIDENKALLQPPVGNKQIYVDNEDFIVMVVGGPNGRKDYHYEEGEELFYQIKGDIEVKIINEEGNMERIPIKEGKCFCFLRAFHILRNVPLIQLALSSNVIAIKEKWINYYGFAIIAAHQFFNPASNLKTLVPRSNLPSRITMRMKRRMCVVNVAM